MLSRVLLTTFEFDSFPDCDSCALRASCALLIALAVKSFFEIVLAALVTSFIAHTTIASALSFITWVTSVEYCLLIKSYIFDLFAI